MIALTIEFDEAPSGVADALVEELGPIRLKLRTESQRLVTFKHGQSWDQTGRYRLRSPYQFNTHHQLVSHARHSHTSATHP